MMQDTQELQRVGLAGVREQDVGQHLSRALGATGLPGVYFTASVDGKKPSLNMTAVGESLAVAQPATLICTMWTA
jgi:hypothetical protein